LTALLNALPGRTWTGKESLLKAISAVCLSNRDELLIAREEQPAIDDVVAAMLKECRKENVRYKMEALRCTANILHLYDVDRMSDVGEILLPLLAPDSTSSLLEDVNRDTRLEFRECAYECLGKCWPRSVDTQVAMQQNVADALCCQLTSSTWKVQLSAVGALRLFVERLCCLESAATIDNHHLFLTSFIESYFTAFSQALANVKYSNVRSEALAVVNIMVQRLAASDRVNIVNTEIWNQLLVTISNLVDNESQPDLIERATQLIPVIRSKLL
jgi:proteasome component ECM29